MIFQTIFNSNVNTFTPTSLTSVPKHDERSDVYLYFKKCNLYHLNFVSNPCVDIQRKRIEERLPNSRMPFPLPIRAFTSIDYTAPEIYTRGLWTKTERLTQTSMPTFSVLLQTFLLR